MLLFDIGANRGDATIVGLALGYEIIAIEPGRIVSELIKNFIYEDKVTILNFAVSDKDFERIEFYECVEDGLSTTNRAWLTNRTLPYCGKEYFTTKCNTITIDTLAKIYGEPSLIKIDVEGAEWSVLRGMTKYHGKLAMEWTLETIPEHQEQINYLKGLGYTQVAPQFIESHLEEPDRYFDINLFNLRVWRDNQAPIWEESGWKRSGLRPTADVGMLWAK